MLFWAFQFNHNNKSFFLEPTEQQLFQLSACFLKRTFKWIFSYFQTELKQHSDKLICTNEPNVISDVKGSSSVCFRSPSCHYKYLWTLKQARQRLATIEVVPKQEASHSCNSDAIYQCSAAGPQSTPDFAVQWAVSGFPVHPSIMICLLPFGICRGKHVSGYTTYIAVSCTFV